jgi:hypothetical protein
MSISGTNVLISDNLMNGGFEGGEFSCTNLQIRGNTVLNATTVLDTLPQGFGIFNSTTVIVTGNTITNTGIGILSQQNSGVRASNNHISQCQQQGILSETETGGVIISNNQITCNTSFGVCSRIHPRKSPAT